MTQSIAYLISVDYQSTIKKYPQLLDEFNILRSFFSMHDVSLIQVPWQKHYINWQLFSCIMPKACWDYVQFPNKFESLLKKVSDINIPMKNNASIVKWNMRKTYLLDLQKSHLPIGEFTFVPQHSDERYLTNAIKKLNEMNLADNFFIAKPSIGLGGVDLVKFNLSDVKTHYKSFLKILSYADLILQPFFPEIIQTGEYSYIFFNNKFSHAVLKKPKANDFRAHFIYGAKTLFHQPSNEEIDQAFSFISGIQPQCLYARVDGFRRDNKLFLIELELIEPYLYLEYASKETLRQFCESVIFSNDH